MAQPILVVLKTYWRMIFQQLGIVLYPAFLMGSFSFGIAHVYKPNPIYKATSKVQISSPQTTPSFKQAMGGGGDADTLPLQTYRSIITSFPVIRNAADQLGLFDNCFPNSSSKACGSEQDSTYVVLNLQASIETSQEGYTNIIAIEATGLDKDWVRRLADTVAEVFADYNNAQKNEKARKHRLFVEYQREQARIALSIAEDSLRAHHRQHPLTPQESSELKQLQRELRLREETVRNLEREYQDAKLREADKTEEVTVVQKAVTPPGPINPQTLWPRILLSTLIGLLFGMVIALARGTLSRIDSLEAQAKEAQDRLMAEMEKELQTAHEMQMALMPKEGPQLAGFDLAGRCIPANHVGGDLFQYFHQDGKLAISLADVTGHAMAAAIPVVMFSGILKSQLELGGTVRELFTRLNGSLRGTLGNRTFVCFAMGQLEPATRRFQFSNAGCPYPYHYSAAAGTIVEMRVDAYPLGVRPDTSYQDIEIQLEPGDRVVFCSDGIIEATNEAGEMFGFERTAEVIRKGCQKGLSAEMLLERIIQEVKTFSEDTPQGDDQTVVVLKVGLAGIESGGQLPAIQTTREREIEDLEDEVQPQSRVGSRVVAALSLLLVGLGLAWQSGYLAKPLGLIPLLAEYPLRQSTALPPVQTTSATPEESSENATEAAAVDSVVVESVLGTSSRKEPAQAEK